jgi:hypothetical protein
MAVSARRSEKTTNADFPCSIESGSLIRRHPKVFFVSFEHLVQRLGNPFFHVGREACFRALPR